jgi:hypothetical protein
MKQLQDIEQKDIIKRVTGRITKLWEPKTFNGPKGEFTIQGGEIEIDGDHYGLKFINQQHDSDKLKGRTVTLVSTRWQHGLNGVTLDHESFSKKDGEKVDRDVIKVTATGKIEIDGQQQQSAPKAQSAPSIGVDNDPKITLDKLVESHMYINDLVRVAYHKKGYDEETLRSYVASIFIEANKRGIQASHVEAKPAYDPADWASAIVPSGSNKGKKLAEIGKPALKKLYAYYLEKGFESDFARCVEQASIDLKLDDEGGDPIEEQDDIPW